MDFTKPMDPLKLCRLLWPRVRLYKQQEDLMYSVWNDDETVCVAGNLLGKDYVGALIILSFFLTRHPCRIVTTSADYTQLRSVLWGEIRRFISSSRYPLTADKGGPLVVNDLHIRKMVGGKLCGISYIIGRCAEKGEGMLGHHATPESEQEADAALDLENMPTDDGGIPRTLGVSDEASGMDDRTYNAMRTWGHRIFLFGNPEQCENAFKRGFKEGTRIAPDGRRCYRRVIQIKGADSPNVRLAMAEQAAGRQPSHKILVPGVLTYREYVKRRSEWDPIRQCIGLDAEFYEGAELLLFPPAWLNKAERLAEEHYRQAIPRRAKGIGIDPAEGGDKTALCAVDDFGVIEMISMKTPDTSEIMGKVIAFGNKHGLHPSKWFFDRGGGGKQIADMLRSKGYNVETISFGSKPSLDIKRGVHRISDREDIREEATAYKNIRAEMYHQASMLLDPSLNTKFGIPGRYHELRRQLAPIPKTHDDNGVMYIIPKSKPPNSTSKVRTLNEMLGCSPDEADAFVLAVHAMQPGRKKMIAGAGLGPRKESTGV